MGSEILWTDVLSQECKNTSPIFSTREHPIWYDYCQSMLYKLMMHQQNHSHYAQHLAQTCYVNSNKKQRTTPPNNMAVCHCTLCCVPCSVWVGDGNLATVADACITIRLLSCPIQSSSSEHSLSLKVPSRRRKTTWRQWLTCQDMQVEEPLLITAGAAAPSMLQVRCQAALYVVSLTFAQKLGCKVLW